MGHFCSARNITANFKKILKKEVYSHKKLKLKLQIKKTV